jgi:glutamate racemase
MPIKSHSLRTLTLSVRIAGLISHYLSKNMSYLTTHSEKQDLPIGVFDSGMGGLTVLKQLKTLLPQENFIYLGDTARLPYGTKSKETVIQYALQCAKLLINRRIKLLVVACNTVSAVALPALQEAYPTLPIIGVLEPGAQAAVKASKRQHITLLATEITVAAGGYQAAIKRLSPQAVVKVGQTMPLQKPLSKRI